MRDTDYATELARATIDFVPNSQGRIERLLIKRTQEEAIRFSWWKENRLIPRPLDVTEKELLTLLKNAIHEGVFSGNFLVRLKGML